MFYLSQGSAWGDWANYTDSPLRAFENEIGVQPPVGFWDPVGFTSTGDAGAFQRRRAVEIKHGRVSMFAAMGYITPEYVKLPGYLSPSQGLEYSDMPNGLAAISKVRKPEDPVVGDKGKKRTIKFKLNFCARLCGSHFVFSFTGNEAQNLFLRAQGGVLVGGQKVYVENVYVSFSVP